MKYESDCKNQIINDLDFFERLVKTNELLKKEKYWNTFKNLDKDYNDFISMEQFENYIKSKKLKVDSKMVEKLFKEKDIIKFVDFYEYLIQLNIEI